MAYQDPRSVCSPWATEAEICACLDESVTDCATGVVTPLTYPWTDTQLIEAASNYLYQRTCYTYPGVCVTSFWPCVSCACDMGHPCGCGIYRAIPLGFQWPVREVTEIQINGVILDPLLYRVDDYSRLVRTDGECWPSCNNLDIASGPAGDDMEVFLEYGIEPPIGLKMAVIELVCQYKRSCEGQPCEISGAVADRLKKLNRRGTEIEVASVIDLVATGLTGNMIVDQALQVYGNCGGGSFVDPLQAKPWVNVGTFIP